MRTRRIAVNACLLFALCLFAQDDIRRSVTGVVVDDTGQPLLGAEVSAWPITAGSTAGNVHWLAADKNGKFSLILKPGRYLLRARASSEAYPDPSFLLSADSTASFPEITVRDYDLRDVRVQIGRKGGLLKGDVCSEDGGPISNGKVTVADANNPNIYVVLTTDREGRFEFTAPVKPLLINASAKGFLGAAYNSGAPVSVSSGKELEVHIRLTRIHLHSE